MSKRTRIGVPLVAGKIKDLSVRRNTCVTPLASALEKRLAEIGGRVVEVSQDRLLIELQIQGTEMNEPNDDLIKTILPVFRELARTQKLVPYPSAPSAGEIELREGIAEAKAVIQKRAQKP